jgi:tetratricopeptide (TPR) repeat protein
VRLLAVFLVGSLAQAAPPSQEDQARAHFIAGQGDYAAGRYEEALHEFEVGYGLAPRPEFLINFAQTYRKLGRPRDAAANIEQYLATGPSPALADEARRLLRTVEEEERRVPPPSPAPVIVVPAPPPPPPLAKRKSRAWIWGVVVGSVVVAAAVTATAVLLTQPPETTWPDAPLGRYSFR